MNCPRGQLLYILLANDGDSLLVAFDLEVSEERRAGTKARSVPETCDVEDAIELKNPRPTRHVRFDNRYNWKCDGCDYIEECNEHLRAEIDLPTNERRWWDTYRGAKRSRTIPEKWKKSKKT